MEVDPIEQADQATQAAAPHIRYLRRMCYFPSFSPEIMQRIIFSSSPSLTDIAALGQFLVDKEVADKVTDEEEKKQLFLKTASTVYPG